METFEALLKACAERDPDFQKEYQEELARLREGKGEGKGEGV